MNRNSSSCLRVSIATDPCSLSRSGTVRSPQFETNHERTLYVRYVFRNHLISGEEVEASKRALERTEAIVHAELKRGLGGLATIGSTAPFVGLLGTVVGIINAFKGIQSEKATGLAAVAGGISEALVTTAIGLFVAIPAVMMFNYLTGRVEAFDVEMDNSSSELIDYFLKRRGLRRS